MKNNLNKIHLQHDLTLTKNEYNNFQKLKYHGLVAKYKEDGKHVAGYWVITRRGADFLRGDISLPKKVWVYSNKLVGKSADVVSLRDVKKDGYYFEKKNDIEYKDATVEDVEVMLTSKRRKNLCPSCSGELKVKIESEEVNGAFRVSKSRVCTSCNFDLTTV